MGGVRIERGAPFGSGSRRELGSNMRGGKTHRRNTGPMLSSPRCGARTRSGKPCRSPAVPAPSSIGQALSPSGLQSRPEAARVSARLRIFFSSGCSLGPTAPTESPFSCSDSGRVHPNPFFQQAYAFTLRLDVTSDRFDSGDCADSR